MHNEVVGETSIGESCFVTLGMKTHSIQFTKICRILKILVFFYGGVFFMGVVN